MKHFLFWILLLTLTGCCRVAKLPSWPVENKSSMESTLYRFRLEHSSAIKFSGLLALKPREDGMWSVLLDATGVPLVKMLVQTDGTKQIGYCAAILHDSRLPELLGKLVEYIYFTPARTDCPWYVFTSVCLDTENPEQSVKKKKMGPIQLWEVKQTTPSALQEIITVHMNLSSITVHLLRINTETDKGT